MVQIQRLQVNSSPAGDESCAAQMQKARRYGVMLLVAHRPDVTCKSHAEAGKGKEGEERRETRQGEVHLSQTLHVQAASS